MRPAYQRDTPIPFAITVAEAFARAGRIFSANTCLVSHEGCFAGPAGATSTRRRVAIWRSHFLQCFESRCSTFPHPRQILSGFGIMMRGTSLLFTSRLFRWVRRVAILRRATVDVVLDTDDQSVCATYSAVGATFRTANSCAVESISRRWKEYAIVSLYVRRNLLSA